MKINFIIILFYTGICTSSCNSILSDSGPGTLGSSENSQLNCSNFDVENTFTILSKVDNFKIADKDSTIVKWWSDGGYDFLTYRCINIKKRIYMISIDSEAEEFYETNIGIRAVYNRGKKEWIFAKEFNSTDKYRAKKAMERLMEEFDSCK